jgi:DNA invertase Pin-like site-specific DNA recombinase
MKAIILARVSTKEQEEGHSIAAQRQRLIDYCARKGLDVIRTFEIVESSTRGERKEFNAMLEFTKAQEQTVAIVVNAVDRFQRDFKESVLIDDLIRRELQADIAARIEQHQKGEGDYRLTLESLISLASRAAELFERSKMDQKRQLVAFVFSNLQLRGKKLEFSLRSPFDLMVNRRDHSRPRASV